jgi:hypothetical protein
MASHQSSFLESHGVPVPDYLIKCGTSDTGPRCDCAVRNADMLSDDGTCRFWGWIVSDTGFELLLRSTISIRRGLNLNLIYEVSTVLTCVEQPVTANSYFSPTVTSISLPSLTFPPLPPGDANQRHKVALSTPVPRARPVPSWLQPYLEGKQYQRHPKWKQDYTYVQYSNKKHNRQI